ncbi:MAG: hypothetical protein IMZ55_07560, partial [Acidobacteria bacterium]|nr:hypothetical protein [Acidobacteriota bacterium]
MRRRSRSRTGHVPGAVLLAALLLPAASGPSEAGVRRVWAVNDTEKIAPDNTKSALATSNSAWDGRRVRLFGARNEVLAFQVVVEADEGGIGALSLSVAGLRLRSGTERIVYAPPAADPSNSIGRPIQVFVEHYM